MISIKDEYKSLIGTYSNNEKQTQSFWLELKREYESKTRHYHNLSHILELLQFFHEFENKIIEKDIVLFAIFYHDIIYDVKKNNNEEKSAEIAKKRMNELNFSTEKINLCYGYIIATKLHKIEQKDSDLAYFLDFDLAILGKDWDDYLKYTGKIRKEFSIYPNILYRKGRKKALNSFLDSDRIYKTTDFFNKFEIQARKNIRKEINELL